MAETKVIRFLQKQVWQYYHTHGRYDLPWRIPEPDGSFDPYKILVSEIMLQQTQVSRVLPKFALFMRTFPTFAALAAAPLAEVLRTWSGLGYNRRAKFLHQTAIEVTQKYAGRLPQTRAELMALPGIGPNTAGAILAYAYNQPVVFIETNIRSVFIHHFFADGQKVPDAKLLPLIQASLPSDGKTVRGWYWALMDYGTHLKQTVGNTARASAGYTKQSAFKGSRRQVRGQVLRALNEQPVKLSQLRQAIDDDRLPSVLQELEDEGFIEQVAGRYRLHA